MMRCVGSDKLRADGLVLDNVATLPEFALAARRFFLVVFEHLLGLFREYSTSLFDRQFRKGQPIGQSERSRCFDSLFFGAHRVATFAMSLR